MTSRFHDRVFNMRTDIGLGKKEIAYKHLNMGQLRRAIPGFLEAAAAAGSSLFTPSHHLSNPERSL
jgi:hypothetical protein